MGVPKRLNQSDMNIVEDKIQLLQGGINKNWINVIREMFSILLATLISCLIKMTILVPH